MDTKDTCQYFFNNYAQGVLQERIPHNGEDQSRYDHCLEHPVHLSPTIQFIPQQKNCKHIHMSRGLTNS